MRRTKEEAQETRDALLDAAEAVFHREGVARATLSQIASEAKVTRGAIYWHFSGKAALFKAMCERVSAPEEEFFVEQAERRDGGTLANLRALGLEMVRRFVANGHAQRVHEILLFRCEYVGEMSEALAERREKEKAFDRAVLEAFDHARQAGELGAGWTSELAAAALRCAVMGAISDWLRLDRGYDLMEVAALLLDSLFASYSRERPSRA
ncbi:TetR family transcriptional regulator [Aureimonas endophytica]|uniref:TetR family transcriptional regulator n=1 Tax=Aureimonas endophytica TaxID=2027858 RepID=A0A917E1J1_9HYPH|nr:TetR family transcriptional regulator [Aureimonas endophytica]GGD92609.1 TetR family transcriptional regulator [Aureimonas endophytica]